MIEASFVYKLLTLSRRMCFGILWTAEYRATVAELTFTMRCVVKVVVAVVPRWTLIHYLEKITFFFHHIGSLGWRITDYIFWPLYAYSACTVRISWYLTSWWYKLVQQNKMMHCFAVIICMNNIVLVKSYIV